MLIADKFNVDVDFTAKVHHTPSWFGDLEVEDTTNSSYLKIYKNKFLFYKINSTKSILYNIYVAFL